MMKKQDLLEKKLHIERFRQSSSLSPLHAQQIQQSILNSWQRSEIAEIPVDRQAAPLNSSLSHPQGGSALQRAVQNCAEDLKHIAQQSDMWQPWAMWAVRLFGRQRALKCVMWRNEYIL